MFSKTSKGSSKAAQPAAPSGKRSAPSLISADLRIVGDLHSDGEIQVDGTIDGDIRTLVLLVGETANIKGEIVADTVHVHGTVNGQIKARAVNLAKSARVIGDILHEDLSIEAGAFLEGHCKRIAEKKSADEGKINLVVKDSKPAPDSADSPPAKDGGAKNAGAKEVAAGTA